MKFIPAIDLKDNKCVRLEKGKEKKITIFNDDPVKQAKFFEESGCERIHLVDLDSAFGRKNINNETIINIRKNTKIIIELGGGIKSEAAASYWLDQGIDFLVIGSLAAKNKELVFSLSKKYKNKIYVALDLLKKKIMIKGWVEESSINLDDIINFYNSSSTKGFVLTDISRDGMLQGLDTRLFKSILAKTKKSVIVGGGLSDYNDLENLKNMKCKNLEGVIAGKSFYSGNISVLKAINLLKSNA